MLERGKLPLNPTHEANTVKGLIRKIVLYIILILAALITVVPVLWAFVSSFRTNYENGLYMNPVTWKTFIPQDPTVENYILLFTQYAFYRPLFVTIFVCTITVLLGGLICSIAGYAFSKFSFRFKKFFYIIVLIALTVPFEAIAVPLYRIVSKMNMLDTYWALLLPAFANGMVVFMFKQFFDGVPNSLLESAVIDRAGPIRIFFQIILPLSKPAMIGGGMIMFFGQWSSFLWPLMAARSNNMKVIQVALSDFKTQFSTDWGLIYAASTISILIPVILLLPLQKYYVQGISTTGIKG
jgi:multiple sugar transport system permease protein